MSEFEELVTRVMALPSESRAELAELLIQSLEEPDDLRSSPPGSAKLLSEIKRPGMGHR